jgi:hypothetical protein
MATDRLYVLYLVLRAPFAYSCHTCSCPTRFTCNAIIKRFRLDLETPVQSLQREKGRGALTESDAETIEGIIAPWTSIIKDDNDEVAEDTTDSSQPHERATTQRETLPSSGKVPWGDNGGYVYHLTHAQVSRIKYKKSNTHLHPERHLHFYRSSTHTLVLLKHPPKPTTTIEPLSRFTSSSFQPGNLTAQARLLGFRRSSGQSTPTVVTRRSLFGGAALELPVPTALDHAAVTGVAGGGGATAGLGPAGALSAPGSSSSLETVRAVTSSSSLRTSRFVPRSYSSR